jgi:hypothetical protein
MPNGGQCHPVARALPPSKSDLALRSGFLADAENHSVNLGALGGPAVPRKMVEHRHFGSLRNGRCFARPRS